MRIGLIAECMAGLNDSANLLHRTLGRFTDAEETGFGSPFIQDFQDSVGYSRRPTVVES